jgi:type IV secretory pathway VirJ component
VGALSVQSLTEERIRFGRLGTVALCSSVAGTEESGSLCPKLAGRGVKVLRLAGGHHFGGDYEAIGTAVIAAMDGGG